MVRFGEGMHRQTGLEVALRTKCLRNQKVSVAEGQCERSRGVADRLREKGRGQIPQAGTIALNFIPRTLRVLKKTCYNLTSIFEDIKSPCCREYRVQDQNGGRKTSQQTTAVEQARSDDFIVSEILEIIILETLIGNGARNFFLVDLTQGRKEKDE